VTALQDEAWNRYWEDFKRSAWRLEVQQTYTIPGEQLARFLAGEPKPPEFNSRWHRKIRSWAADGKSVSRVRLVRLPLSDYQKYISSWGVPSNVGAGEDVRILDVTEHVFGLPEQDFWIFDDATVVHLNFNPDGTLIDHQLIDNPDLAQYRTWQETALKNSVPFSEWDARP
jgi:Family of unknown function (DUF6879)